MSLSACRKTKEFIEMFIYVTSMNRYDEAELVLYYSIPQ